MSSHQIHVFISHSWSYSGHYETLKNWIFEHNWSIGQASLDFRNYSIPKNNPILNADNDRELKEAIYRSIAPAHVIVIPTGMYANYSKWIRKEIDGANIYSKPILAVDPWGQERKSSVVRNEARFTVGWNKEPLINAIWRLYNEAKG
jgi:hypothetical protein